MGLLLLWALCALATSYCSAVPSQQSAKLLSRGCNDSDVLSFAGFALENINKDRKDGYVFSLNRVSDAREQRQDGELGGSLFYLTLDVLETSCHVLTRKSWKDCQGRALHETVYGQCKALFYINKPRRVLYTVAYNCTIRPGVALVPGYIGRWQTGDRLVYTQGSAPWPWMVDGLTSKKTGPPGMNPEPWQSLASYPWYIRYAKNINHRRILCPDCPRLISVEGSNPTVLEAVTETLAKYNAESTSKQYSLFKATRATISWVYGPFVFVEYLIKELPQPCTKSMDSTCVLQSPDYSEPVGLCHGSLIKVDGKKTVTASCEFFETQVEPRGGNVAVQPLPAKLPKVQDPQDKKAESAEDKRGPKGTVQLLPELEDETPEQSQDQSPVEPEFPVHLDLTTDPEGLSVDVSFLFFWPVEEKLLVLPFPSKEERSSECPGPAQNANQLVLPP